MCILIYVYMWVYAYVSVCTCVRVYLCLRVCVFAWYNDTDPLVWSEPIARDSDLYPLWIRYIGDWKLTHRIIPRFVPVRSVKTRRHFGSKIASFHVRVCFCIISLFTVVSSIYMLFISFHVTICFILPIWLPVSLHEVLVSVQFDYITYLSAYQYHFMCSSSTLLARD